MCTWEAMRHEMNVGFLIEDFKNITAIKLQDWRQTSSMTSKILLNSFIYFTSVQLSMRLQKQRLDDIRVVWIRKLRSLADDLFVEHDWSFCFKLISVSSSEIGSSSTVKCFSDFSSQLI